MRDDVIDDAPAFDTKLLPVSPPLSQCRRSSIEKRSFIRCDPNEILMLRGEGEPKSYVEVIDYELIITAQDGLKSLHEVHSCDRDNETRYSSTLVQEPESSCVCVPQLR